MKQQGFEHDDDFGAGWDSDGKEEVKTPELDSASVDTENKSDERDDNIISDDDLFDDNDSSDDNDVDVDGKEQDEDSSNEDKLIDDILNKEEEESYKKRYADTRAWAEKSKLEADAEKAEMRSKLDEATKQLLELKKTHSSKELQKMDFDDLFDEDVSELFETYPGLKNAMIGMAERVSDKKSKESFQELYPNARKQAEAERNNIKTAEDKYWSEITNEEFGHENGKEIIQGNTFKRWWDLPINNRLAAQVNSDPQNTTLVIHAIDKFNAWKAKKTAERIDAKNKTINKSKIDSAASQVKAKKTSERKPTSGGSFDDGWNSV